MVSDVAPHISLRSVSFSTQELVVDITETLSTSSSGRSIVTPSRGPGLSHADSEGKPRGVQAKLLCSQILQLRRELEGRVATLGKANVRITSYGGFRPGTWSGFNVLTLARCVPCISASRWTWRVWWLVLEASTVRNATAC